MNALKLKFATDLSTRFCCTKLSSDLFFNETTWMSLSPMLSGTDRHGNTCTYRTTLKTKFCDR